MNFDRLSNAPSSAVASCVMHLLNAVQDFPKEQQLAGSAALFLMLSEGLGVPAQDTFTATKNLLNSGEKAEFNAAKMYIQHEIK